MNKILGIRTGGRSARVQAAVHRAVYELLEVHSREVLTLPQVAQRAGVTPSTLYRRWGDLATLLGEIALERMHAADPPEDTGSLRGDLLAWTRAHLDDTSPALGGSLREVVASQADGCIQRYAALLAHHLELLRARASQRGETPPPLELLLDGLVAPLIYHLLFDIHPPGVERVESWLDACLAKTPRRRRRSAQRQPRS